MEKSLILTILSTGIILLDTGHGFPIEISSVDTGESNTIWSTSYLLPGIGLTFILVGIVFGCVCCRNNKGFKEFSNSSGSLAVTREGFVNPTLNSELTIFPPLGSASSEICRFEPLPDIKPPGGNLRPAAFSYAEQEISSQDWFSEPYSNFPRNQLKYLQEYGRGWFGRVVEGEAQNIVPHEKVTKTMVKILHEDATPTDQMYFLHEVKFYRDLKHPNVLRLLGRCLETEPFLIILECYPNGDLKTFLSQNLPSARALVEQGVTLQMCSNITNGLQFMHQNKFIHTDLAARNCLVAPDLTVKIGDYGNSIEIFNSDYYCAGSVALPVRWCAPETLKCTDITIETREVTQPANIWSLGVVFWEICEFCKLPYAELNDDQVIVRVLGEKNYFLEKPKMMCLFKDEMYHLMKLCWNQPLQRPTASQILAILNNLISSNKLSQKEIQSDSKRFSQNFEQRWQNLKPNSIPKKDNTAESEYSANCGLLTSKLKNAKVVDSSLVDSPLGIFMSNTSTGQETHRVCLKSDGDVPKKHKTESEESVKKDGEEKSSASMSATSERLAETDLSTDAKEGVEFQYAAMEKQPQALNPGENSKGTQYDMDSWLKGVEINNEEDENFVRKISEAIRDLDAALAQEKTSSSEENSEKSSHRNSPGKEVKETKEPVIDFKLGSDTSSFLNFTQKSFEISSLQNTEQPQSLNFADSFIDDKKSESYGPRSLIMSSLDTKNKFKSYGFYEGLKENDSLTCGQSRNSSDTDDETWRKRIEKGEISEKVKEKSKSIANLMVLTHIDSDDSDIDFDKPLDKSLNRSSFRRRSGSVAKSSPSNNFGSENDLVHAVLEEDFKESLKKLSNDHKEYGHFDSLGVILSSSVNRDNVWESFFKPTAMFEKTDNTSDVNSVTLNPNAKPEMEKITNPHDTSNFLGDVASEKVNEHSVNLNEQKQMEDFNKTNEEKNNLEKDVLTKASSNCDIVSSITTCNIPVNKSSSHLNGENSDSVSPCDDTKSSPEAEDEAPYVPLKINQSPENSLERNRNFLAAETDENVGKETTSSEINRKSSLSEKGTIIPEIRFTEAEEEDIETVEEVFVPVENKPKPFKLVMKDDDRCIPNLDETPNCDLKLTSQISNFDDGKDFNPDERILQKLSDSSFPLSEGQAVNGSCKSDSKNNTPEDNGTVIIGACEAFTLDYYRGLKTTSEDMNETKAEEKDNISNIMEDMRNKGANLDGWDQHLEKTFTQQLSNANFDYVSFRSSGLDSYEDETKLIGLNEEKKEFPLNIISDFIESEKIHTEKMEESINLNRLMSLTVMPSEEEYENFKLRTPDDERSSDSGFRDKGSLSESVEDACEGKYNLEDIEAELEEAYVKGVFGNCETETETETETEKEKEKQDSKNFSTFEFEEAKFYEDENKNEEDYSDIDGEIDFWQNKDDSEYYPEISEFSATCSQGWYLHPPEENVPSLHRNVNEDLVNALRNELQESLPIQARSFDHFNDFYETEIKEAKRDLNIHYPSDFGLPLSPITEEQNFSETEEKNNRNSFLDGNMSNKYRKSMTSLMESAKAIDTNTFMQYLDYMIENEGRDLDELELTEEEAVDRGSKGQNNSEDNFEEDVKSALDVDNKNGTEGLSSDNRGSGALPILNLVSDSSMKDVKKMEPHDDLLVVNVDTDEATLLEGPRPKPYLAFPEDQGVVSDCSENEGLIFTPEMLSPEKERSLSEISKSSNGTRTGDALSDITMSSPDLIPDCFNSVQDILPNNEASEIIDELKESGVRDKLVVLDSSNAGESDAGGVSKGLTMANDQVSRAAEEMQKLTGLNNQTEANDVFEMSTSFMWSDEDDEKVDDENDFSSSKTGGQKRSAQEKTCGGNDVSGWESDSSENEDMSSSSGEFIWKDGDKESKVKVAQASDCDVENSLNETSQSDSALEIPVNEICPVNGDTNKEEAWNAGVIDDDGGDNDSSTESSASITDFVPSAWNSQATPSRPALRSPDKKDQRKKSVWFKKQKYHCVYEYPQEPSDDEEPDNSTFTVFSYDKSPSDSQDFFNYDFSSFEVPKTRFSLGTSKVADYLNYSDWDLLEEDKDLDDADAEKGFGKLDFSKNADVNFFDQNPFDYDFNSTGLPESKNEFLVSSSSRPFHGSSSSKLYPRNDKIFVDDVSENEKPTELENRNSYDFATPDSGLEDSTHADLDNETFPQSDRLPDCKSDVFNTLDNLKFNFPPDVKETSTKKMGLESSEDALSTANGLSSSNDNSPIILGELRYARDKLKLDLPYNHNTDLGAVVNRGHEQ